MSHRRSESKWKGWNLGFYFRQCLQAVGWTWWCCTCWCTTWPLFTEMEISLQYTHEEEEVGSHAIQQHQRLLLFLSEMNKIQVVLTTDHTGATTTFFVFFPSQLCPIGVKPAQHLPKETECCDCPSLRFGWQMVEYFRVTIFWFTQKCTLGLVLKIFQHWAKMFDFIILKVCILHLVVIKLTSDGLSQVKINILKYLEINKK